MKSVAEGSMLEAWRWQLQVATACAAALGRASWLLWHLTAPHIEAACAISEGGAECSAAPS